MSDTNANDHIDDAMFLRDVTRLIDEMSTLEVAKRVARMMSERAVMVKYVQHLPRCNRASRRSLGGEWSGKCDCGLADAGLPVEVIRSAERF